jgi:hypothetical protein
LTFFFYFDRLLTLCIEYGCSKPVALENPVFGKAALDVYLTPGFYHTFIWSLQESAEKRR